MAVRKDFCANCPFRRCMSATEVAEVRECPGEDSPPVLCHTDGFENDAEYTECRGFHLNTVGSQGMT